MSQAMTALVVGHGARFGVQIPQAPPGLEISKRGDLSSSSRAAYVHSRSHSLTCKRPLYVVDKQCSFVAFAMQSDRRQNANYRRMTNQQEKVAKSHKQTEIEDEAKHLKELLASFPVVSNGRKQMEKKMNQKHINARHYNQNGKHINAKHYNRNDMQDDRGHMQPEIQASFPEDANYPKARPKSTFSSTDGSTLREIVALFKKAKSKPEEGSDDEDQKIQMSNDKDEGPVNSVLRVLRQYSNQGTVNENGSQKFAAYSRNGKSGTRSLKGKFSQSAVLESNSKQKSSLTNKLRFERPPSNFLPKSSIASPVVRQQEQVVYTSSQSEDTEFEDYSFNVGHGNKAQLESDMEESDIEESDMEYAAPDYDDPLMPDISSTAAVKTGKSESLINGTPVELSDTLCKSSFETKDSDSFMNGAATHHPPLLVEQKDLSTLKLSELKIIAKSRGLKGFSKFKKAELLELLRQETN